MPLVFEGRYCQSYGIIRFCKRSNDKIKCAGDLAIECMFYQVIQAKKTLARIQWLKNEQSHWLMLVAANLYAEQRVENQILLELNIDFLL